LEKSLKLILNELKELKDGQQELKKDISSLKEGLQELKKDVSSLKVGQQERKKEVSGLKDNLIDGLVPYFEHIEKHIDKKTAELKDIVKKDFNCILKNH